jgi:hypothetical protein
MLPELAVHPLRLLNPEHTTLPVSLGIFRVDEVKLFDHLLVPLGNTRKLVVALLQVDDSPE